MKFKQNNHDATLGQCSKVEKRDGNKNYDKNKELERITRPDEVKTALDSCRFFTKMPNFLRKNLFWQRCLTFLLITFERLWLLVMPLILLICVFLECVWFGVFARLPLLLHVSVLAMFIFATIAALYLPLFRLKLPTADEIDRQIEKRNALTFQPLRSQSDTLAQSSTIGAWIAEKEDVKSEFPKVEAILWREHLRRMQMQLQNLKIGLPVSHIPKRDPHGLRSLIFLSLGIAFSYSFSIHSGQLQDVFSFSSQLTPQPLMRIDAWVNPPEYTGMAPLYLNNVYETQTVAEEERRVPQGSVAHFQINNAPSSHDLWYQDEQGQSLPIAQLETQDQKKGDPVKLYQFTLNKPTSLQLVVPPFDKKWIFTVIPDEPLQIDWAGQPRRALNGVLELPYHIDDDYGAIKAWAEVQALNDRLSFDNQALYDAPIIDLLLPVRGKGDASTRSDLTNHPWAGIEVLVTLHAQDGAGHMATSSPLNLTLPQRSFGNPLARAIVEQRRLLVSNRHNRYLVGDMLATLLIRPQDTIRNAAHVIALQSAWTRLSYAQDDEGLRQVADYLWQIAQGIENDGLNAALERLKVAQQALRDALRNGASAQEIERLMQQLRQAMQDYMMALAQRQTNEPFPSAGSSEQQFLTNNDLEQKLQQLEELAKLGSRGAAEQLLSELENLLDNLQIMQGQSGSGRVERGENSAMQQNMDALADMMRRQQEMMNETDELNKQRRRGESDDEAYAQAMEDMAHRQEGLRDEWRDLKRQFDQQNDEGQNGQSNETMDEATTAMGQAGGSFNKRRRK